MLGPNAANAKPWQRLGLFQALGQQAFMRPLMRPYTPTVRGRPPLPAWYVQQGFGRRL
jgi:hypothetical protein